MLRDNLPPLAKSLDKHRLTSAHIGKYRQASTLSTDAHSPQTHTAQQVQSPLQLTNKQDWLVIPAQQLGIHWRYIGDDSGDEGSNADS